MKDLILLASQHRMLGEHSSSAWCLELILQLYGKSRPGRFPFQRDQHISEDAFPRGFEEKLRRLGISCGEESYGKDFGQLERALRSHSGDMYDAFPIVRIPSAARVEWNTGGLIVQTRAFVVVHDSGMPFILTQLPSNEGGALTKLALSQMRHVHDTWSSWPAVLPSMFLSVLRHRRL